MRRSRTLGWFRSPWPIAAAALLGAAGLIAGCGKEQPAPEKESPAKEPPSAAQTKASPEAAGADRAASPAAPGMDKAAAEPAAPGAQAKANPNKAPAQAPPAAAAPTPVETAAPSPASATGDSRAAEVTSPKVSDGNFTVWMQSAGKHKVGQQGAVEIVLIPKNGFHCNENYPYKIKLSDPPSGVTFPQPVVRKEAMSVSPQRGVMTVPFVASAPGSARIAGKFSFSVCTTDQCLIDSRDLAITVNVE